MYNNVKENQGITLIALIITVIIMVILSAISINSIYNMGIVDKATKGVQDYASESVKENQVIGNVENLIEETVSNLKRIDEFYLIKNGKNLNDITNGWEGVTYYGRETRNITRERRIY